MPLKDRLNACEQLAEDPRIKITAFESAYNVRYTADTLALIKQKNPDVNFVWLMGADNLKNFHLWQRWRQIALTFPIAVIDRPGSTLSYMSSLVAKTFDYARTDEEDAPRLVRMKAPAWAFIHGPRSSLSSSAIRGATRISS
jgi:nicotinate-nucleotide adenylyltransferase